MNYTHIAGMRYRHLLLWTTIAIISSLVLFAVFNSRWLTNICKAWSCTYIILNVNLFVCKVWCSNYLFLYTMIKIFSFIDFWLNLFCSAFRFRNVSSFLFKQCPTMRKIYSIHPRFTLMFLYAHTHTRARAIETTQITKISASLTLNDSNLILKFIAFDKYTNRNIWADIYLVCDSVCVCVRACERI